MPSSNKISKISVEEYLASEVRSFARHEYVDGQVFAMSGVSRRHNIIAGHIYAILRSHLRGSPCRAYISDVKARVEATNSFYYPDVMVSCDKFDDKSVYTSSPVLIVEVLSASTATIDRREKVLVYRQIESLKEYLIVHQRKKRVELHRRNVQGGWDVLEFGDGSELELESVPGLPLTVKIDAIYEDLDWPEDYDKRVREVTQIEGQYDEGEDW